MIGVTIYDSGYKPYVSVAERRKKSEKAAAKLSKNGEKVSPIRINGRTIAKTFWGKAWCEHLESFSDYENRLPRGRTYVRNGSVIHLAVEQGQVTALVQGSSLYKIKIDISAVDKKKWNQILDDCSGQIDSVVELLQGKLSSGVMTTITDKSHGLFPQPKEIKLNCSCPDWADMCKHVAAVLYGVGSRLDQEPELLFKLRHVDHLDLVSKASLKVPNKRSGKSRVIEGQDLSNLFGVDIQTNGSSSNLQQSAVKKTKPQIKKTLKNKSTPKKKSSRGLG